jgi:hypothetical protein
MRSERIPSGANVLDEPMDGATSEDLTKSQSDLTEFFVGLIRNGGIVLRRLRPKTRLHPVEVDLPWGYLLP